MADTTIEEQDTVRIADSDTIRIVDEYDTPTHPSYITQPKNVEAIRTTNASSIRIADDDLKISDTGRKPAGRPITAAVQTQTPTAQNTETTPPPFTITAHAVDATIAGKNQTMQPTTQTVEETTQITEQPPVIRIYDEPWEKIFGAGAELLFVHFDNHYAVYQPKAHPDIIIKDFKEGISERPDLKDAFATENEALQALQDSRHFPRLLGRGPDYLVEQHVVGLDSHEMYKFGAGIVKFPPRDGTIINDEQKERAALLISSLEALTEIHEKGFAGTNFGWHDWLWDPINKRLTITNLANTKNLTRYPDEAKKELYRQDIIKIMLSLFNEIEDFHKYSTNFNLFGITESLPSLHNLPFVTKENQERELRRLNPVDSLRKLITMNAETVWHPENIPTTQEYLQAMKAYFQEVGLYQDHQIASSSPAPVAEPPTEPTRETPPPGATTLKNDEVSLDSDEGIII